MHMSGLSQLIESTNSMINMYVYFVHYRIAGNFQMEQIFVHFICILLDAKIKSVNVGHAAVHKQQYCSLSIQNLLQAL